METNGKKMSLGKKVLIGFGVFILIGFIANLGKDNKKNISTTSDSSGKKSEEIIKIGDVLTTDYFEIRANKIEIQKMVDTGNEYLNLKEEPGNLYLIINATYKNIDSESRMLFDGSLWINYNEKDYEFDKSEPIMAEGWGLLLDQINPLTSKTTNLVYKIPEEIKGDIYWQPGRSSSDEKIYLGKL